VNIIRNNVNVYIHFHLLFRYIGRFPAASTATGNKQAHMTEISHFMKDAMDLAPVPEDKATF